MSPGRQLPAGEVQARLSLQLTDASLHDVRDSILGVQAQVVVKAVLACALLAIFAVQTVQQRLET